MNPKLARMGGGVGAHRCPQAETDHLEKDTKKIPHLVLVLTESVPKKYNSFVKSHSSP